MQITINTDEMSTVQAAALIAMLAALHPTAVKEFLAQYASLVGTAEPQPAKIKKESTDINRAANVNVGNTSATAKQYGVADLVKDVAAALDPADNPATGTASAAEVFTQGVAPLAATPLTLTASAQFTYAQYMEAGWTDDALIAAGYALAPGGNAETVSDAARVFGGAGGPLTTSSGEQPVPSNTGATSPLQSADAMTVFAAQNATPAPSPESVPASAADTTTAQELDADGLPWDGRIHASTRTKTAKNVWKKKKGVDDGLVAQVVSELRTAVATVKAAAFTPLNATAAPSAPPPPPPPAGAAPVSFVEVARFVGDHKITGENVTKICAAHGIPGLAMLTQHPNLAAPMLADFKKLVGVA